jgi:hypothetical protein
MLARLTRIALAMAVAFVFTGQVEAAANHCARLAALAQMPAGTMQSMTPAIERAPCHEQAAAEASSKPVEKQTPDESRCECLAVLTACASPVAAEAKARMEAYVWASPEAVTFASFVSVPDLRPPRA